MSPPRKERKPGRKKGDRVLVKLKILSTVELRKFEQLETMIKDQLEMGRTAWMRIGAALRDIRDQTLFLAVNPTWEQYVQQRWGGQLTRRSVNRMIEAANTAQEVAGLKVEIPLLVNKLVDKVGHSVSHSPSQSGGVLELGKSLELSENAASFLGQFNSPQKKANIVIEAAKSLKRGGAILSLGKVRAAAEKLGLFKPNRDASPDFKRDLAEAEAEEFADTEAEEEKSIEELMQEANLMIESACRAIMTQFKDLTARLVKHSPWIEDKGRLGTAEQTITTALKTLRSCKGHCVCMKCSGLGCKLCLESGWIDKITADTI